MTTPTSPIRGRVQSLSRDVAVNVVANLFAGGIGAGLVAAVNDDIGGGQRQVRGQGGRVPEDVGAAADGRGAEVAETPAADVRPYRPELYQCARRH